MKKFSLGFIFDKTLEKVLLIHKNRPVWQAGKINGIGGKIESNEDCLECIVRETEEESGLKTAPQAWHQVATMQGADWEIAVFYCIYNGAKDDAVMNEDQPVEWFAVNNLPENVLYNLRWLIPLCIDAEKQKEIDSVTILYNENNPT